MKAVALSRGPPWTSGAAVRPLPVPWGALALWFPSVLVGFVPFVVLRGRFQVGGGGTAKVRTASSLTQSLTTSPAGLDPA